MYIFRCYVLNADVKNLRVETLVSNMFKISPAATWPEVWSDGLSFFFRIKNSKYVASEKGKKKKFGPKQSFNTHDSKSQLLTQIFAKNRLLACYYVTVVHDRRALRPTRRTWRSPSPSSAVRTWCVACAWRWCSRRPIPASVASASSPTATTATASNVSASGGAPSSLRARS